jgi:hypothetical protein
MSQNVRFLDSVKVKYSMLLKPKCFAGGGRLAEEVGRRMEMLTSR